jgi:Flp pilus assembly protein TadG
MALRTDAAKRFCKDESGQIMALMAIGTSFILLGFLALSVDVGMLYHARQNAQIAADSAAIAAAVDYEYNLNVATAETAGRNASATNGYTNGTNSVVVSVVSPATGCKGGVSLPTGYFQATVTAPTATSAFLSALGFPTVTVSACSVAGLVVGDTCLWALASTGTGFDVQGSYDVQAPQCGAYVNSTSSNAIKVTGNGGTMDTKYVDVVGNSVGHQTSPTPISTGATPQNNPWANTAVPNPATACTLGASGNTYSGSTFTSANVASLNTSSGYVCFSNNVTMSGSVNMPPTSTVCNTCTSSGIIYIFQGNLTIATGATVSFGASNYNAGSSTFSGTNGAMIDLSCSSCTLNQNSNSLLNMYAPTAGSYNGIAIYQPLTNTTELQVQFGSNNENLDGYIFAPGAEVFMQDSGGGVTAAGIVADTIYEKTSALTIPLDYDTANATTTINKITVMVE